MTLESARKSERDLAPDSMIHTSDSPEFDLVAFHLLGDRSGLTIESMSENASEQKLRPALFAHYKDLTKLRYDFPLILVEREPDWVRSLSDSIDAALQETESEPKTNSSARQVMDLEYLIRKLLSEGQEGTLSVLWEEASRLLLSELNEIPGSGSKLEKMLADVRAKIGFDGEIINYKQQLPIQLIRHAWNQSQKEKSFHLKSRIDHLNQKLSDILRVDYLHSSESRAAGRLESSLGAVDENVFDFQAMARILKSAPVGKPLPEKRKTRISEALAVFESQRFVADNVLNFEFDSCELARDTFNERLPDMAALIKAMSIAELEIENRYDESRHDLFYSKFDENQLGPEDLALFPSYLICLQDSPTNEVPNILLSGLPFKIIVLKQNIVGESASGQLSFGTNGQQLAHMAMGLNNVFVLQAAATSLYQLRESVMQGLTSDLPALFSLYTGSDALDEKEESSRYLSAAAATESRLFPCFVFNPANGENLASRFHLMGNANSDQNWQNHTLSFEDSEQNRVSEAVSFTLADFIACDKRFSRHFVCITRTQWSSNMLPIHLFLKLDRVSRKDKVPYVLLIDDNDQLLRAICDVKVIDAINRNLGLWHKLQELDGINNSHVNIALQQIQQQTAQLSKEQKEEKAVPSETPDTATATVSDTPANTAGEIEAELEEPLIETASDEPWIETIRCTSCNECTLLNDRMFAYNDDIRAYIADAEAGTYKELVEAAESCQVAIIHPGKPKNPDEPGLDDLITRAEPFIA